MSLAKRRSCIIVGKFGRSIKCPELSVREGRTGRPDSGAKHSKDALKQAKSGQVIFQVAGNRRKLVQTAETPKKFLLFPFFLPQALEQLGRIGYIVCNPME